LASVLGGLASSPHAFLVKTINVELAPASAAPEPTSPLAMVAPMMVQQASPASEEMSRAQREAQSQAAFRSRYGVGGGQQTLGGIAYRGLGGEAPQTPTYAQPAYAGAAPAAKGGLPTVLDEKLLKITLNLYIIKPLPAPAK
jgi:hypothetical protein